MMDLYQKKIIGILKKTYPAARIALNFANHWELLVAVILSAQCTDIMVNKVTRKLFAKYKTLDDYVNADHNQFEQDIKSTGFYHNKAKNILASAELVKERFGSKVPDKMKELISLPGVARKTGNIVLGNAYHVVEGIAVDTHVIRISQRLRLIDLSQIGGKKTMYFKRPGLNRTSRPGLELEEIDYIKDANPEKIEKELMKTIPKGDWQKITYMIIDHGRAICKAQNPNCTICPLKSLCPSVRVN